MNRRELLKLTLAAPFATVFHNENKLPSDPCPISGIRAMLEYVKSRERAMSQDLFREILS